MKIEWREAEMTTGFPEVDAQHQEWLARFKEFDDAVIDGKGRDIFMKALMFFLGYAEAHFAFEEAVMEKYGCTAEALNKEEHDRFRVRIKEIEAMVGPQRVTMLEIHALKVELENWLVKHIIEVDTQLRLVAPKNL